jgi:hypothetical protein
LVAEDRLGRNHRQENYLFSAVFNRKTGETRYHFPPGIRLNHDTQLALARAFAKRHAKADHDTLPKTEEPSKAPTRTSVSLL